MSFASQNTHLIFPFAYIVVFNTIVESLQKSGCDLNHQDRVIGRITASTGMSLFTWGENITIIVEKIDEKNSSVVMESALKIGMNAAGAHRHAHNFEKLIRAVSAYLQAYCQPQPPPKPAP